jgi:hypothetical protein
MQELGIPKPPQLVRSRSVNAALLGSSLSAGIGGAIAACPELASLSVFVFIGVVIITAGVGIRLTRPLCREFPKELQTVGDLARWVMTHKSDLANATAPGWTRDQITIRVREIIVEQLGVKPDFSEDANFVKDLGMG